MFSKLYEDPDGNEKFLELKQGTTAVAECETKFVNVEKRKEPVGFN